MCVCVSLSLALSFCSWLFWLLGYCVLFLLFLCFSFMFGFKFFIFFSFLIYFYFFFKKIMGYNVKRISHIVGCSGCFEWWVFFLKLKISWLTALPRGLLSHTLSLSLSFFLSHGILSQLWLRCYMNIKLMSFHVCFGRFFFYFSLTPSLHTNMMKEFKRGVRVCVCLTKGENKKSYCNLDTIIKVCVEHTIGPIHSQNHGLLCGQSEPATHKGTIHWMPMVTQLWMKNLNGVKYLDFHLGNPFCKK